MVNQLISFIRRKIFRMDKYRWDFQYINGRWDDLRTKEMERLFVTRDLLKKYNFGGKIFEIGCGEGVLFQHIEEVDFSFFEGIDISEIAITKTPKSSKSVFKAADMETYIPSNKPFTVIVLNEVLYYSKNPLKLLKRYIQFLEKDGVFLIGMYDTPKSKTIWQTISYDFIELESIEVKQDSKIWYYKVLKTVNTNKKQYNSGLSV